MTWIPRIHVKQRPGLCRPAPHLASESQLESQDFERGQILTCRCYSRNQIIHTQSATDWNTTKQANQEYNKYPRHKKRGYYDDQPPLIRGREDIDHLEDKCEEPSNICLDWWQPSVWGLGRSDIPNAVTEQAFNVAPAKSPAPVISSTHLRKGEFYT